MKFFYDFSNSRLLIEEQNTRWFLSETTVYNFIILDILFYIISIKRFENEKYYKQKKNYILNHILENHILRNLKLICC